MDVTSYLLGKKSSGGDTVEYLAKEIPGGGQSLSGIARTIIKIRDDSVISSTSMAFCFSNFAGTELPLLDTSKVTNMKYAFDSCLKLETIPKYNTKEVINFSNAFYNCPKFTDETLDNILQMCIDATNYTGTKTLVQLGMGSYNYSASRIQALPHYQDFLDAGWTIGW